MSSVFVCLLAADYLPEVPVKAAIILQLHQVETQVFPDPHVASGELLVQVTASGI